jgi:hypothetical protein
MGVKVMRVCAKCYEIIPAQKPVHATPAPTMDQVRAQVAAEDLDIGGITSLGGMAAMLGQPAPGGGTFPALPEAADIHVGTEPPVALERSAPAPIILERANPPSAEQIEDFARRRLEFVRAEIAKLRGYEDEETRLSSMLDALAPASGERAAG